mmetsp:Transcript_29460/g.80857  ORF Transcript_29460/g.80857 Transcript_29460/m.80857 type:complete len:222 (+) Transcript_29460:371-1036(+)
MQPHVAEEEEREDLCALPHACTEPRALRALGAANGAVARGCCWQRGRRGGNGGAGLRWNIRKCLARSRGGEGRNKKRALGAQRRRPQLHPGGLPRAPRASSRTPSHPEGRPDHARDLLAELEGPRLSALGVRGCRSLEKGAAAGALAAAGARGTAGRTPPRPAAAPRHLLRQPADGRGADRDAGGSRQASLRGDPTARGCAEGTAGSREVATGARRAGGRG